MLYAGQADGPSPVEVVVDQADDCDEARDRDQLALSVGIAMFGSATQSQNDALRSVIQENLPFSSGRPVEPGPGTSPTSQTPGSTERGRAPPEDGCQNNGEQPKPPTADQSTKQRRFTAVVLVHGIGRHVRHENAGKLLEAFEVAEHRADDPRRFGKLRAFNPGLEPMTDAPSTLIEFMEFSHFASPRHHQRLNRRGTFRLYEFNWSPITKAGLSSVRVLGWLLRALPRGAGDWRNKPMLRLARLHHLRIARPNLHPYVVATLASRYRLFRGTQGSLFTTATGETVSRLTTFQRFLRESAGNKLHGERLAEAAAHWDVEKLPAETRLTITRATATCYVITPAIALTLASAPFVLQAPWSPGLRSLDSVLVVLALLVGSGFVMAVPRLLWFLGRIFSDVRFWASYDHNDEFYDQRRRILEGAADLIAHVAEQPHCKRIVVIAHSLGTAIAFDAIREVERRNQAWNGSFNFVPSHKISHFFSLGSPIDKLAVMFEAGGGATYRAMSLRERLRGNLGDPPFWRRGTERVKWINFWDRSDPVSDPLFSPLGSRTEGDRFLTAEVENVEVMNTVRFDPTRSHTAYFDNPRIVDQILDAVLFTGNGRLRPVAETAPRRTMWSRSLSMLATLSMAPALLLFAATAALRLSALAPPIIVVLSGLPLVLCALLHAVAWLLQPSPSPIPSDVLSKKCE